MTVDLQRRATRADRRVALALLRRLDVIWDRGAGPVTVHDMVEAAAAVIGTPILVRTLPRSAWFPDTAEDWVTGVAVRRDGGRAHLVLVRDDLDPRHRDHVVAHELAHLLLGHGDLDSAAAGGCGAAAPADEQQAEAFADLVCTRLLAPGTARDRTRLGWSA